LWARHPARRLLAVVAAASSLPAEVGGEPQQHDQRHHADERGAGGEQHQQDQDQERDHQIASELAFVHNGNLR